MHKDPRRDEEDDKHLEQKRYRQRLAVEKGGEEHDKVHRYRYACDK